MTKPQLTNYGRVSGVVLMLLGVWGALIPFVGPYFAYAYTPNVAWTYNSGRLYLSIVPGAIVFLGGLIVVTAERAGAAGGILAGLGGAWFVAGQHVTAIFATSIRPGSPAVAWNAAFGVSTTKFLEELGFFYGLGVLIVFFAALAIGRVTAARSAEKTYGGEHFDFGDEETKAYSTQY